jgi:hypothetical protein
VEDAAVTDVMPRAVGVLELYDYPTRSAALRLLGSGDRVSAVLDDTVASPRLREILMLLAHMAFQGIVEYYGGWDTELAGWTVSREALLAEELEHPEAHLFNDDEGTDPVRVRTNPEPDAAPRPHLAIPREAEVVQRPYRPYQAYAPAGALISLRGLAIRLQQERGIDVIYG